MKNFRYNKKSYYALYDKDDNCIATFDKIKDLSLYIGYKRGQYLSTVIQNFNPTIELKNKEMITELLYVYEKQILLSDGTRLDGGAKIYRFVERD